MMESFIPDAARLQVVVEYIYALSLFYSMFDKRLQPRSNALRSSRQRRAREHTQTAAYAFSQEILKRTRRRAIQRGIFAEYSLFVEDFCTFCFFRA